MNKADWVWMPHAGHLIVGHNCRFHLATYVGGYIVSTVGEYLPDAPVREIIAESRGITLEGKGDTRRADYMAKIGYEQIGAGRLYETMVFRAVPAFPGEDCCPWRQRDGCELDFAGYNDAAAAFRGHLAMCEEWSKKE
jgi:hypothetical protein